MVDEYRDQIKELSSIVDKGLPCLIVLHEGSEAWYQADCGCRKATTGCRSPFEEATTTGALLVLPHVVQQLQLYTAMDLPLPDFKSLPGRQIYYLYGFAGLLLLLLLAVFRAVAGPSKQTGPARKVRGTSNVLFIGPMASGKTSLFGRVSLSSSTRML